MIGYIYLTTDLLNGRKYIGKHKAKQFEPHRYLGSNKHLKSRIAKYGKENFTCEMLQECFTFEELNEAEKYWIAKYDAFNSDEFYNLALGGEGGAGVMRNRISITDGNIEKRIFKTEPIPEGFHVGRLPRDCGAKISAAKKGKPSKSKGKIWINNGVEQTMANECPEGWVEGRLKVNRKCKLLYNNGTVNKWFENISEVPEGWIAGPLEHTWDSNNRGRIAYNDGVNHIYLPKGIDPPEGYIKGYSKERKQKNSESSQHQAKGKKWYNNGIDQKYFSPDEPIPEGWVPGTCKHKKIKRNKI